jgi:hypothetical protein
MDEDLTVLKPNGGNLVVNLLLKRVEAGGQNRSIENINLLTVTGSAIFSLSAMNEGRCFGVETVQLLRRLLHICIVLRHKLPGHFRWDNIVLRKVSPGTRSIRHDGVGYTSRGG